MNFELWGFTLTPYIELPASLYGYVIIALWSGVWLVALWQNRAEFQKLTTRQWTATAGLAALGVLGAQLFIFHLSTANLLPIPGFPAEPRRPGLALLAFVPAFLAGGWLGVVPALLIGFVTGLSRAAWDTYSAATPFEFAFIAGLVAWCARQDYRGQPAGVLRHPLIAGTVIGIVFCPLLFLSYSAYSPLLSLTGWEYVASLVWAAAPVFITQAVLAGGLAQLARRIWPERWPFRAGRIPPPYVSSLNRRLLFALIPLFVIGIGVLFWANISIATNVSTTLIIDEMQRAAQNADDGIPFFIQTGNSLIRDMAGQEKWFDDPTLLQKARLAQVLGRVPFFKQLTLFDAQGAPLEGYPAGREANFGLTGEEEALVSTALDGIPPQEYLVYPPSAESSVEILFTSAILDPQTQQPRGVLIGRADFATNPLMQSVIHNLQGLAGGNGHGFILDENHVVIYDPEAEQLLQSFNPEPAADPLRSDADGNLAYEDIAPNGTRRIVVYHPVRGYSWKVAIVIPNQVVLELATQISTPVIAILLIIGSLFLVLVSFIANRVTRPAEDLALAAQRISEGQLDRPVVVQGEDEIGRAGLAFERMRLRLQDRLDELNLLLRVSQGVAARLDLSEAVPIILQGALSAGGASGARVVLVPTEEARVGFDAPPVQQTFAVGAAAELMALLDRGVLNLARVEGRVVLENLVRARAVLDVAPVGNKLQALLALPLRQEQTFYGVLWLGYDQPHNFTEAEFNFLTTLAGQAAVAVANARLFDAANQGRQRLAAIVASTPDAVIVTDRNDLILLLNPEAEAVFDLTGKPTTGRTVAEALPYPELIRLLKDNQEGGKTEIELTGRTLYASASPIVSAEGAVLGKVCVLRDVTHFKELDLMKSEFVATVSHDLRAPLTFMRGYATMLPMVGALSDKQREFADKITLGIEQMTQLIDNLLDLGRIEAGVGLARETCRIDQLVYEVIDTMKPQALNKNITLTVELPENLPPLSGDRTLLRQAIANLVDNAIKYTAAGGQVTLKASADLAKFLLAVNDTGVGIAPADQAHLFEKFFRVRQRGSTQIKGSGLGLAIVKSIAERHGGRVWVDSKLGRGSTFFMEVPAEHGEAENYSKVPAGD